MKQVTMESVKQRIADLESAGKVVGGLSLSSEFELACLRELVAVTEQRGAVVAENAALKDFCKDYAFQEDHIAEMCMEYGGFTDALNAIKTPATDAAIAALRAEVGAAAIEEFVRMADYSESIIDGEIIVTPNSVFAAGHEYARQLRESKGANHE
ncbi:hypothetical protein [Phytobacter diazotrophicus]|uniref:hypothetical protein n=1 Tax=Phytobacter diazotrophicus TaxID=395631 RepID=UPI002FFA3FFD